MSIANSELPDRLTKRSAASNMPRSVAVLVSAPAILAMGVFLIGKGVLRRGAQPITAKPTDLRQIDQAVVVFKVEEEAAVLAATQRPLASSVLNEPSGVPAWQTIPSWDIVGTADHIITPAEQLFMANRAHAHITEINAPHLSMITDPGVVASVIIQAARATS